MSSFRGAAGQEWEFEDIEAHQERMLELMLGEENKSMAI
jgi:hypothetical protein